MTFSNEQAIESMNGKDLNGSKSVMYDVFGWHTNMLVMSIFRKSFINLKRVVEFLKTWVFTTMQSFIIYIMPLRLCEANSHSILSKASSSTTLREGRT